MLSYDISGRLSQGSGEVDLPKLSRRRKEEWDLKILVTGTLKKLEKADDDELGSRWPADSTVFVLLKWTRYFIP